MENNEIMELVEVENFDETIEEYDETSHVPGGAIAVGIGLVGAAVAGAAVGIKKAGGLKAIRSKFAEKKVARLEKKLEKEYTKIITNPDEPIEVEPEVIEK